MVVKGGYHGYIWSAIFSVILGETKLGWGWSVESFSEFLNYTIFMWTMGTNSLIFNNGNAEMGWLRVTRQCLLGKIFGVEVKMLKTLGFGPLLEVPISKKCTPWWREAHFEVKMLKTLGVRTTFGSSDLEKVHAVVARSTFWSQNVKNTRGSDHFWRFRCRFASLHQTTLHYTTLHSPTLHYITLHYTPQHYNYNYTPLHYTPLH